MQNGAFGRGLIAALVVIASTAAFGKPSQKFDAVMESAVGRKEHNTSNEMRNRPFSWQAKWTAIIAEQQPAESHHNQHGNGYAYDGGEDRTIARQSAVSTERQANYAEIGLWVGAVAALATAWAAWAAATAAKAAAASNEIARDIGKKQLRAYVSGTPTRITYHPTDKKVVVEFSVFNHGQTPAQKLRHHGEIMLLDHPIPDSFQFPALPDPQSISVLHPTHSNTIPISGAFISRGTFDWVEISSGNGKRIYIFGEIFYADVFGVEHWTRFCSSVHMVEQPGESAASNSLVDDKKMEARFEHSLQHNETDDG